MMIKSGIKNLVIAGFVAATACATTANAAGDPTKDRQTVMGNVGAATKAAAGMAKGQIPFNLEAAQLALKTMNSAGLAFGYMFPDGSETGNETEAAPAIWSDRAGFDAAVAKFIADSSGAVKDEASFKAAFGAAAANCGSCHKAFRVKK